LSPRQLSQLNEVMSAFRNAVFALLAVLAVAVAEEEGPAEKVVKMMAKLKSKVIKQGEKEDAEFNSYAKFCATTLNEKAYQLKRSEEKNASMTADKAVADQKIQEANDTITLLTAKVATDETDLVQATSDRAAAAMNYSADAKEITDAMDALDKATAALSAAKKDITALASLQSIVGKVLGTASRVSLLEVDDRQLSALESLDAKPSYNFRPTEVVAMLKGLTSTFKENKQRLDMQEEVAIGDFNKLRMNLNKQLEFTKEDLDQKVMFKSQKVAESAQLNKDISAESAAHAADTAFKTDLEADCKAKDDMDKSRQTNRQAELEAIQSAIDTLAAGGVSLAEVKVQTVAAKSVKQGSLKLKKTGSVQVNKVVSKPKALMQLRSQRASKNHAATMAKLRTLAAKTGVAAAARLVEQAASATDPFVEVRKLFSELLARMDTQAKEEASNNANCTQGIAKHATERDDKQAQSETLTNTIAGLDAKLFKLNKEVQELTNDVSEAAASLTEAEKQRANEHATYVSALKEAQDGLQGSTLALSILTDFYKKQKQTSFLQSASTVGGKDKPDVNMGDYMGEAHQRSAGVLGMLEVLKSDFEHTKTEVEADEQSALSDFQALQTRINDDITVKNTDIDTKKSEISDSQVQKGQAESSLEQTKRSLELALEKLDAMRGMCTENEESYATRRQKRQEEIDHLKKTVTLLDDLIEEGQ